MTKTVWKLAPYPYFEVEAIEDWLDELSGQGLQFQTKFGPICTFERSPSPARYRMDIRRKGDERTDVERISSYRELGWDFCSDYTRHAEIYRAQHAGAAELHTDESLLRELVKRSFREQLWGVVLFALLIADTARDTLLLLQGASGSLSLPYLLAATAALALVLLLLSDIAITLRGYFHQRRHDFCALSVHTPKRARRGALLCLSRILLVVLFVVTMVLALFSAA